MPTWDPSQYLKFADHRLRPALDLIAQIPLEAPRVIFDLGCGAGNVTRFLNERWPKAKVTGVDSSAEMIANARREVPGLELVLADIANWSAQEAADLLFSNATLHWLDDHRRLLPRLMGNLAPGGVLAIQLPRNPDSPSHRLIGEVVEQERWRQRLGQVREVYGSVETAAAYYDILAPFASALDIWESEYLHVLEGDNPVAQWTKGTALRPYLDLLDASEREDFFADYAAGIAKAYPKQKDGRTLFPFRRLFIIANR